ISSLALTVTEARPAAGGAEPATDRPATDEPDGHKSTEDMADDTYPLTPMQAGMVFHGLSQGDQGVYFQQLTFLLDGVVDPALLAEAWQQVVNRTPVLRSSVLWEGTGGPRQVVHRDVTLPVTYHDWRRLSGSERDGELRRLLDSDRTQGLDLSTAPLMRLAIARVSSSEVRVVWTFHHVLLDGWARRHRLTMNTVVQGAWALLLSRYSGQRGVCFGATVSGRPADLPGVDDIVGIFINTLPVRVDVDDAASVVQWLRELQAAQVEARGYEHVALTRLHGYSAVPGGVN